jgi:dTDP-4-amino-4,6-dideoxygalactose transaminase
MSKIIGGMFGLPRKISHNKQSDPFNVQKQTLQLINARSCIYILVQHLSPSQIWIPSFLCNAIVESVSLSNVKTRYFEVNNHLEITSLEWLENVRDGDLVIVIDYFGFPQETSFLMRLKSTGAWILEDACQTFPTEDIGVYSDFVLFSPRKLVGVPDGGILNFKGSVDLTYYDLQPPPPNWWLKVFKAALLRREFDIYGGDRYWFTLFQDSEADSPIGEYEMSELSKNLLIHNFDYDDIANTRLNNYLTINNHLSEIALFPNINYGVIPLGYPIILPNRDKVREILFSHNIYPPIHWSIEGVVPKLFHQSHQLSSRIMTLPCDHRYNSRDMERMVKIILDYI